MVKRKDIISAAKKYIGTKFSLRGRSLHGLDCIGTVVCPGLDCGLSIPDCEQYVLGQSSKLVEQISAQFDKIKNNELRPASIIIFNIKAKPNHVALYIGDGQLIEVRQKGLVVQRYLGNWVYRIHSVYDYKGIEPWQP